MLQLTREILTDEDGITLLPAFDGTRRVIFKLSPSALADGLGIDSDGPLAVDDAIRVRWEHITFKCTKAYGKSRQSGQLIYITMPAGDLF